MRYINHDTSAADDEKLAELFIHFGYEGYGLFWAAMEKIGKQEKPIKTAVLKKMLKVGKRLEKCWSFMEEIGLINTTNGETFNKNLLTYAGKYAIKKEKTAERVRQFRERQADTEAVTRYNQGCNADKVNESKVNESKEGLGADAPTTPEEDPPEDPKEIIPPVPPAPPSKPTAEQKALRAWEEIKHDFTDTLKAEWVGLCKTKKWRGKEQSTFNKALKKVSKYQEGFVMDLVENAVAGGYQGLTFSNTETDYQHWLKKHSNGTGYKPTGRSKVFAPGTRNYGTP